MDIKELGHNLQAAREHKGLTVDDVVQRTKISRINVLALEAGDLAALPHPVYAKGFVRNYAKLLGLDPEEYAQAMSREFLAEDNVAPALEEGEAVESMSREVSRGGKGKWIVAGLVLLAVGLGLALVYGNSTSEKAAPGSAAQPAPQAAPATERPLFPAPAAKEQAPQPPEAAAPEAEPGPPAPAAEPAAQPEAHSAPAAAEAEPQAVAPEPATAPNGRRHVLITALEPCWILAQVDGGDEAGGVTVDVMLQPGQSKVVHYAESMTMKLGNAGGVRVELDGKPFAFEAQSGQVKTLVFPED